MNENGSDRSDRSCYINRYHANIKRGSRGAARAAKSLRWRV